MIFKAVRNRQSGTLLIAATVAFIATVAAVSGQDNPDMEAGDADPTPAPQPLVLHVHHHYYTNQGGEYQYTPAYRTYLGAGVFGNQNPGVFFTAPAGGEVTAVNRGEKRKFLSLEIEDADNVCYLF